MPTGTARPMPVNIVSSKSARSGVIWGIHPRGQPKSLWGVTWIKRPGTYAKRQRLVIVVVAEEVPFPIEHQPTRIAKPRAMTCNPLPSG